MSNVLLDSNMLSMSVLMVLALQRSVEQMIEFKAKMSMNFKKMPLSMMLSKASSGTTQY